MDISGLFDVRGKTVLVTGGAQGLGRMIAEGFVAGGARVIITSRKPEIAEAAAAEMAAGGDCTALAADLASAEGCTALAQAVAARWAKLDVLVNNAGRTWGAPLESFPDKAWSVLTINVQSPFTLVRDLLPLLRAAASEADPARVINIGSAAGLAAESTLSAYSYAASKAAIIHLSRVLAAELAPSRITVNTVAPGYFPTQMTAYFRKDAEKLDDILQTVPLRRLGAPEDAAGVCIMLASRAGAYITGATLVVDGGLVGCR